MDNVVNVGMNEGIVSSVVRPNLNRINRRCIYIWFRKRVPRRLGLSPSAQHFSCFEVRLLTIEGQMLPCYRLSPTLLERWNHRRWRILEVLRCATPVDASTEHHECSPVCVWLVKHEEFAFVQSNLSRKLVVSVVKVRLVF